MDFPPQIYWKICFRSGKNIFAWAGTHATSKLNMVVLKCPTRYFLIKFASWGSVRVRLNVVRVAQC